MRKLAIILVCILLLAGCNNNEGSNSVLQDEPSTSVSNVPGNYDGELTLDFSFGTRTGVYSGEIDDNGLPNGQGKFTSENSTGETWTYEGDWVAGHWEGNGIANWASGQRYTGTFSNDVQVGDGRLDYPDGSYFEGTFTDNSNATGFVYEKNCRFYAKIIDDTLVIGGVWGTGEFGEASDTESGSQSTFDMNHYIEMVREFHTHVATNTLALGSMGVWETEFLENLGRTSDDMIEKAYDWLEKSSDYTKDGVMAEDQAIIDCFSAIVTATTSDEVDDLFLLVKTEYDCYVSLYSTVTEIPFSVSAFGREILDNLNALNDSLTALNDYFGLG